MINRPLEVTDLDMLQKAMDVNKFHPGQKAESYAGKHMQSFVYEDDTGPIGVLQCTKTLRLRTIWCNNDDHARNGPSVMQAIADSVKRAEASGFTEIIFQTDSPLLANFCTKKLGFEESRGEYRLEVTPKETNHV